MAREVHVRTGRQRSCRLPHQGALRSPTLRPAQMQQSHKRAREWLSRLIFAAIACGSPQDSSSSTRSAAVEQTDFLPL